MRIRFILFFVILYNYTSAQTRPASVFVLIPALEKEIRNASNKDELFKLYDSFEKDYPEKQFSQVYFLLDQIYTATAEKMLEWEHTKAIQYIIKIQNPQDRNRLMEALPGEYWQSSSLASFCNQYKINIVDRNDVLSQQYVVYAELLKFRGRHHEALVFLEEKADVEKLISKNANLFIELYQKNNKPIAALAIVSDIIKTGKGDLTTKTLLNDLWIQAYADTVGFEAYYLEQLNYVRRQKEADLASRKLSYKAPDFELKDLNGNVVKLSNLKGKVVFMDFWATWCKPCLASFPSMQQVLNLYKDNKDVVFLFVNTMESVKDETHREQKIRQLLEEKNLDFRVVLDQKLDAQFELVKKYKVSAIPAQFVIDRHGNVCYELKGFDGNSDGLIQEIDLLIQNALKEDVK